MTVVTHVSPAAFGAGGAWGGGERYAAELAHAMAELVPTRLVTFGDRYRRLRRGPLEIRVLPVRGLLWAGKMNPLSELLVPELLRPRILHMHQWRSAVTNLGLLAGRVRPRTVVCSDHGGGSRNLADEHDLSGLLTRFLAVSAFSARLFPQLEGNSQVIYGGVDTARFRPPAGGCRRGVVFVGRLLPHKGIDVLIRALPAGVPLDVYGRAYDPGYRAVLQRLADGRDVTFHEQAGDAEIVAAYQGARVSVLPSVYETPYGPPAPFAELLGLTLLEAMACATPVIASAVGGMPEVVADGETGFVVAPGDVGALRDRLELLLADDVRWSGMSQAAHESVRTRFTWSQVARRCLTAYGEGR